MTVLSDYVARMVDGGLDQDEAMQIAAELFAAGVASAAMRPSSGALRTRKWRENNRHKTSPSDGQETQSDGVTKRHQPSQSVTCDNASLSIDKNKKEKKERARASQMPDGWRPSSSHWDEAVRRLGSVERAEKELRKFANNAAAKGLAFKKWDAAWDNWVDRAIEWGGVTPKQAPSGLNEPNPSEWRHYLRSFKQFGKWKSGIGPDPGMPGCRTPAELLREFGFEPVTSQ